MTLRGDLTIAEGASVASESVTRARGDHRRDARGQRRRPRGPVRLAPGARVRGNLQGSAVAIDDGAHFSGRLDCEFELPPELGGASQGEARGRASARR